MTQSSAHPPAAQFGWPQGPEFDAEIAAFWARLPPAELKIIRAAVDALTASGTSVEIAVGNLKGGVSKTTTAVYLALLLALTGDPVLVIDADPQNHSIWAWKQAAGDNWPSNLHVLPWATADLPKRLRGMAGQYKHLVIDTSPSYPDILRAALHCVSTFLIVTQPNPMDVLQLAQSIDLATQIDAVKADGLASVILVCRGKKGTNLLRAAVRHFDHPDREHPEVSWPHLDAIVTDRVDHASAFGDWPWEWTDYAAVFAELVAYEAGLDQVPGLEQAPDGPTGDS